MSDLLHAAKVTEMASFTADTEVSSTLAELKASNKQQLIAFQQLSDRINKLSVTPIVSTTQKDYEPPRRYQFLHRIHFLDRRSHSPSPASCRPSYYYDRRQLPPLHGQNYIRSPTQHASTTCNRCGKYHAYRCCPAINANCMNCQRRGHFSNVCRTGRRMNPQF